MSSQRASKKEQANKLNELELVEEEEQLPPSKKAKRQVASGMSNVLSVYMHLYNLTQTQGSFPVMNIQLIRIVDGARPGKIIQVKIRMG